MSEKTSVGEFAARVLRSIANRFGFPDERAALTGLGVLGAGSATRYSGAEILPIARWQELDLQLRRRDPERAGVLLPGGALVQMGALLHQRCDLAEAAHREDRRPLRRGSAATLATVQDVIVDTAAADDLSLRLVPATRPRCCRSSTRRTSGRRSCGSSAPCVAPTPLRALRGPGTTAAGAGGAPRGPSGPVRSGAALAAHQWLFTPPELAMEMLSAHVMPNRPAVTALMAGVSARLGRDTGRSSLEGYRSGPERVDQTARAIYETMRDRRIAYVEPPASWADDGQRCSTGGSAPASTPSWSWPPRWNRPVCGR